MIRFVLLLLIAVFLVWCGTTVKLGNHTFAGHVKRIWHSDETQDLRKGVKDKTTGESAQELVDDIERKTEPVVEKVKRGVKAGVDEVKRDDRPAEEAAKPAE